MKTSTIKKRKTIWDSILKGIASPADLHSEKRYKYPYRSDEEAMRSDWWKVGSELKRVMADEEQIAANHK